MTNFETLVEAAPMADVAPTVTIIIPVFNEEQGLPDVLDGLRDWMRRGEVIVVDDGSTDRTGEIAANAGARVIRHRSNRGYGAALKTGTRAAHGEIIVTMDSDGQHNPADIDRLLNEISDHDMVIGMRGKGSHTPTLRKPGKWILKQVANYLAETNIPDLNSGFRAIRADVLRQFLQILPNGFSFSTTITLALYKEGYNVAYVPIVATPRVGKSTVKPVRDGFNTILLIIRTIALFDPLKVFLPISALLFLTGIIYWTIDSLALGRLNIPSGAIVLLVSAVIVFMFGILADQMSAIRRGQRE